MNLPTSSKPRVLVATADRRLNLRLAAILTKLGHSAQPAADGATALELLLAPNPPEIALLDAALPGQSGLELAAELKRRPGAKQTWIMLLSRSADAATVTAAADAGVDDLLLCSVADRAGDTISEMELRVRLSVAGRVQDLARQLQAQAEAITFHASHDRLTGLWNRESLLSLLFPETDRVQRMATPLAFLLLDLDFFERVNAEYGYKTGDKILQEIAGRLRRYMRSYDLLGRFGEDAFLLALPGCSAYQARHLAGRIRTIMLRKPFDAGHDMITLTVSIGLAQSRGRSPLVVLREAERALASAKLDGRNCERECMPPRQPKLYPESVSVN
ncbi:MAG: diguanylate cyclase [Acidobacteriaceae bacterium]